MSVTVWPTPCYEGFGAASLLPIIYSSGTSTDMVGESLVVLAGEKIIARWGAGAWQRAQ